MNIFMNSRNLGLIYSSLERINNFSIFNHEIFNELVMTIEQENTVEETKEAASTFINNLIQQDDDLPRNNLITNNAIIKNPAIVINGKQSTHTSSVHKSVSGSAIKLLARHQGELKKIVIKDFILKLINDFNHLPLNFINRSTQEALKRISK